MKKPVLARRKTVYLHMLTQLLIVVVMQTILLYFVHIPNSLPLIIILNEEIARSLFVVVVFIWRLVTTASNTQQPKLALSNFGPLLLVSPIVAVISGLGALSLINI